MAEGQEQRRGADRRRRPRGGRRAGDATGFAPLIFVVDGQTTRRDVCDAILARLQFAVAPFETAADALAVIGAFRPDVIVAGAPEAGAMRERVRTGRDGDPIPIVTIPDDIRAPEPLIDAIRAVLAIESEQD